MILSQVLESDIGGLQYHKLPVCASLPKATVVPVNESRSVPVWKHHRIISVDQSRSVKVQRQVGGDTISRLN